MGARQSHLAQGAELGLTENWIRAQEKSQTDRWQAQPETSKQQEGGPNGYGSKLNHQGTAGFSPSFHLPRFHFGHLFLTQSQMARKVDASEKADLVGQPPILETFPGELRVGFLENNTVAAWL